MLSCTHNAIFQTLGERRVGGTVCTCDVPREVVEIVPIFIMMNKSICNLQQGFQISLLTSLNMKAHMPVSAKTRRTTPTKEWRGGRPERLETPTSALASFLSSWILHLTGCRHPRQVYFEEYRQVVINKRWTQKALQCSKVEWCIQVIKEQTTLWNSRHLASVFLKLFHYDKHWLYS